MDLHAALVAQHEVSNLGTQVFGVRLYVGELLAVDLFSRSNDLGLELGKDLGRWQIMLLEQVANLSRGECSNHRVSLIWAEVCASRYTDW